MTPGPTDGKSTTAAGGPGGMPAALPLSEGLGPPHEEGMFVHLASAPTMCHVAFWFDDSKQAAGFRDALNAACRKHRVHGSIVGSYPPEMARDVQAEFGSSPGLREAEDIIRRAAAALACGPKAQINPERAAASCRWGSDSSDGLGHAGGKRGNDGVATD